MRRRIEHRSSQSERRENLSRGERGERKIEKIFEQKSERDEAQIAVHDFRAGRIFERKFRNRFERALRLAVRQSVKRSPCRKTRCVREQMPNCNRSFV